MFLQQKLFLCLIPGTVNVHLYKSRLFTDLKRKKVYWWMLSLCKRQEKKLPNSQRDKRQMKPMAEVGLMLT